MEWSEEEGEILPDSVDEYYFVDQSDTPVKFCDVPLNVDSTDCSGSPVFLRGNINSGDESFSKLVKGWNFELSVDEHPKIEVLLHGMMHWITLQSPSKSYEALIRTTLVTLQFLHFVKKNPDASSDDVWNSLQTLDGYDWNSLFCLMCYPFMSFLKSCVCFVVHSGYSLQRMTYQIMFLYCVKLSKEMKIYQNLRSVFSFVGLFYTYFLCVWF